MVPLLVMTALAGCATDGSTGVDDVDGAIEETFEWLSPFVLGHDHSNRTLHNTSNNMTLVGHHALGDNGPPGSISEIDVAGGYAFLGIMGYGFQVVDISDPANPELVASVPVETPDQQSPLGLYAADIKTDASGDWVFFAPELSTTPGVLIYDARDKSDIKLAGFWPEPGLLLGCHMIEYAQIGDNEYLFCAPLDNAVYVGLILPEVGGIREIVQVARWVPATSKFVQQQGNVVQGRIAQCGVPSPSNPACLAGIATHFVSGHQDMTFQEDPLTGTPMLTVSFWNLGLRFVDVSIPAAPIEVGSWAGEDSTKWRGVIHTAMMFEDDGRRIAIAIPEGASIPAMFVLDATDYDNPEILAEWSAHDDWQGEGGRFSLHNFQIVDGKVYLAHYHGGIVVLDVHNETLQRDPQILGTYQPWVRETGAGCCGGSWDVIVHEGYVLSANGGGLYVAHLKGDRTGLEAPSSFA